MTRTQRLILVVPPTISAAIGLAALGVVAINALLFGRVLEALWSLLAASAALVWFAAAANVRVTRGGDGERVDGGSSGWPGRMALMTLVAVIGTVGCLAGIAMVVDGSLWRGGMLFALSYSGPMALAIRLLPDATPQASTP